MRTRIASLLVGTALVLWSVAAPAQERHDVLGNLGCLQCHGVRDAGTAPDLSGRLIPEYTVPALAAALWNHTPAMWAEVSARIATQPAPDEDEWAGAFRYLYSIQFAQRPAAIQQGRNVFESRCAKCHGGARSTAPRATPLARWAPLDDPMALIHGMWNHASSMKSEFAAGGTWKKLSGDDLLNLTVYVQSVQQVRRNEQIATPSLDQGLALTATHCGGCHGGSNSFAASLARNQTLMDIGAATWNHVPIMKTVPALSATDFRSILGYVWELQYRGPSGVISRGERAFENKGCITCHRSPSVKTAMSPRPGKRFTPYSMVALGWGGGREMHRHMQEKGVPWPRLSARDVSDLVAYMNTLSERRP